MQVQMESDFLNFFILSGMVCILKLTAARVVFITGISPPDPNAIPSVNFSGGRKRLRPPVIIVEVNLG